MMAAPEAQAMNDVVAFLSLAVPVVALIAISAALLRALGPFHLAALWYVPREVTWPTGVQEEDPRQWDFTARPADPSHRPTGTARGDGPPVILARLHASTHTRSAHP
jgi:hypothetical protein